MGLFAQDAAAAETIKIGMQKPVGGPLYIANDKGYYAAEGLTPDYVFFEAGEPIAVAVASGAVDFGVAGLTGGFYSLAGRARSRSSPAKHTRCRAFPPTPSPRRKRLMTLD